MLAFMFSLSLFSFLVQACKLLSLSGLSPFLNCTIHYRAVINEKLRLSSRHCCMWSQMLTKDDFLYTFIITQ